MLRTLSALGTLVEFLTDEEAARVTVTASGCPA